MFNPNFNQRKRQHEAEFHGHYGGRNVKEFCTIPPQNAGFPEQDSITQNLFNIRREYENQGIEAYGTPSGPTYYVTSSYNSTPLVPPGTQERLLPLPQSFKNETKRGRGRGRGISRTPPQPLLGQNKNYRAKFTPQSSVGGNGYHQHPGPSTSKPQSLFQLNVSPPKLHQPGINKRNNTRGNKFRPKLEQYHIELRDKYSAYLTQWQNNDTQWQFDDKLHDWLLRVLLRANVIPGDMFDIFMRQLYYFKDTNVQANNVVLLTQLLIAVKLKNESMYLSEEQFNEDLVEISRRMQQMLDLIGTFGPEIHSQVIAFKDLEPLITRRIDTLSDHDFDFNLIGLGKRDLNTRLKALLQRQKTHMTVKFKISNYLLTWLRERDFWTFDNITIQQAYNDVFFEDIIADEMFQLLLDHMKFLHFHAFQDPCNASEITNSFYYLDTVLQAKGLKLQQCVQGDELDYKDIQRYNQLTQVMKPIVAALGGNRETEKLLQPSYFQAARPAEYRRNAQPPYTSTPVHNRPQTVPQRVPQLLRQQPPWQQKDQFKWKAQPSDEIKMKELIKFATDPELSVEQKKKKIMIYQPVSEHVGTKKNKPSHFHTMTQIELDALIETIHNRCIKFKNLLKEATEYLTKWKSKDGSWTYNPILQRQIHENITFNYLISDELFEMLLLQIEDAKNADQPRSKVWGYFYSHLSTMMKKLEKKEKAALGLHIFDQDQKNRLLKLKEVEKKIRAIETEYEKEQNNEDKLLQQFIDVVSDASISLEDKLKQITKFEVTVKTTVNGVETITKAYFGMSQNYFENFINTIHNEVVNFSSLKLKCIEYIKKWEAEDKDWKFDPRLQKCLQLWMTHSYMITDDIFNILLMEIECLKKVEVYSEIQFESGFWDEFYKDTEMMVAKLRKEEESVQLHPLARIQKKRAEIILNLQKKLQNFELVYNSTLLEEDKPESEDPNVLARAEKFVELAGAYHISLEEKQKNIEVFQTEAKCGEQTYMGMLKDVFKDFLVTVHERCLLHRDIKEEAIQYLNKWKSDRDSWIYNKFLQTWLLKWISYCELVSDRMFNCIMEQIRVYLTDTSCETAIDWDMFFTKTKSSLELLTNFEPNLGIHDIDMIRKYRLKKVLKLKSQIAKASTANFFQR